MENDLHLRSKPEPLVSDAHLGLCLGIRRWHVYIAACTLSVILVTGAGLDAHSTSTPPPLTSLATVNSTAVFGPAATDCLDSDLDGPWLILVTGVETYDYSAYMIFDGQGTIDEMGVFNAPDSAGCCHSG